MFQLKKLGSIEEMHAVQAVERQVWNTDVTPIHQTLSAAKNGGLVVGAYYNGELVGYQYSFSGYKDGHTYLCSHMLGILPLYQGSGVGKLLKDYQRQLALEMGYSLIVWTYDPLESINAYLNLHKLRAITDTYLENHYGEMNDAINKGLPTDRFQVEWWIRSDHVTMDLQDDDTNSEAFSVFDTSLDSDQFPIITATHELQVDHAYVLVPIPDHFQRMKRLSPKLAMEWRLTSRQYFQELCQKGYAAIDVIRSPEQRLSKYVFKKRDQLSL